MTTVPPPPPGWQLPPDSRAAADVRATPGRTHAPGAVASLVAGIVGLTAVPLVASIVAIVLGQQSRKAARAEPHRYDDQLGQIGRILGWVGLALAAAGIVLFLGFIFLFVVLGAVAGTAA